MAQHIAAVANLAKGSQADVQAVRQQAEAGEKAEEECRR